MSSDHPEWAGWQHSADIISAKNIIISQQEEWVIILFVVKYKYF